MIGIAGTPSLSVQSARDFMRRIISMDETAPPGRISNQTPQNPRNKRATDIACGSHLRVEEVRGRFGGDEELEWDGHERVDGVVGVAGGMEDEQRGIFGAGGNALPL